MKINLIYKNHLSRNKEFLFYGFMSRPKGQNSGKNIWPWVLVIDMCKQKEDWNYCREKSKNSETTLKRIIQGEKRQTGREVEVCTVQPWLKLPTEAGISENTTQGKRQCKQKKKKHAPLHIVLKV